MPQDKDDSVRSALDDILNIESDRVKAEDDARRKRDEETRAAKEKAERDAREAEERRVREEEERRVAEERRLRDEESRKLHLRQLEELRVKQESHAKTHLQEEEMRLKHEQNLAVLDAQKKKIPVWVWVVIGVVVAGGSVGGYILYQRSQEAEAQRVVDEARRAEERKREVARQQQLEKELRETKAILAANETAQAEQQRKLQEIEDAMERAKGNAAELERLRVAKEAADAEIKRLADEAAKLSQGTGGGTKIRTGGHTTKTTAPVTKTRKCIYQGSPLEECFMCPGDPRC